MRVLPLLILFSSAQALNVLVYNTKHAVSHVWILGRMADELVKAGHNVTTLMPIFNPRLNTDGTRLSHLIHVPPLPSSIAYAEYFETEMADSVWNDATEDPIQMIEKVGFMVDAYTKQCEATLTRPGLMASLRDSRFDFAITEVLDLCGMTIFQQLGLTKYAIAQTTGMMESVGSDLGIASAPSYVPGVFSRFSDKMTFFERAVNGLSFVVGEHLKGMLVKGQTQLINKMKLDFHIMDYVGNCSLVFPNSNPFVDFPRPTLAKVVDIGGISVPPRSEKKLDESWSSLLSLRPRSVLVSFGSVALSHKMPEQYKESWRQVFRAFPDVTFIWKYEIPEHNVAEGIDNVVTSKWVPQQKLLADPRLSLFVSHGGMGSTMESLSLGVPLVLVPIFGDQSRNAKMIEKTGSALVLKKEQLADTELLINTVGRVLNEPSFRARAVRNSEMLSRQPLSPVDKFVRSVELAARFGPLHQLDPTGRKLSLYQFYLLDVFALSTVALISLLSLTLLFSRRLFSLFKIKNQ